MAGFNAGSVNGAHIGQVSSREELLNKLDMANATPEQAANILKKFDDAQTVDKGKKEPKKSPAKSMFDAAKGMK